jgi:hypothetical protein
VPAPENPADGFTAEQLAARLEAWHTGTEQHIKCKVRDPKNIIGWCAPKLPKLGMQLVESTDPFDSTHRIQFMIRSYELSPELQLPEGAKIGDAYRWHNKKTKAEVEAELVAVGGQGEQQRLQVRLRCSMPGTLRSYKSTLEKLQQPYYVMLASVMLWLFRSQGVLQGPKAWGMLRGVRPTTDTKAAGAASHIESSRLGCIIQR